MIEHETIPTHGSSTPRRTRRAGKVWRVLFAVVLVLEALGIGCLTPGSFIPMSCFNPKVLLYPVCLLPVVWLVQSARGRWVWGLLMTAGFLITVSSEPLLNSGLTLRNFFLISLPFHTFACALIFAPVVGLLLLVQGRRHLRLATVVTLVVTLLPLCFLLGTVLWVKANVGLLWIQQHLHPGAPLNAVPMDVRMIDLDGIFIGLAVCGVLFGPLLGLLGMTWWVKEA